MTRAIPTVTVLFFCVAAMGDLHTEPSSDLPEWIRYPAPIEQSYYVANLLPPLQYASDPRSMTADDWAPAPIPDEPFQEHYRRPLTEAELEEAHTLLEAQRTALAETTTPAGVSNSEVTALATCDALHWLGGSTGLYYKEHGADEWSRHDYYGVDGPLSSAITALASDGNGALWVGTPLGLSIRDNTGSWRHIRGRDGLPIEHVTALQFDDTGCLWIGSPEGAILHCPDSVERQWYYRASGRYLKDDRVAAIAISSAGAPIYVETPTGISGIDILEHTLAQKAAYLETRLNLFHRRLGLVVESVLDDIFEPTVAYTLDDANDGLWTSWHVAAMSLAYATTGKEAYKQSAKESMHAMIALQNATGIPGLPARTIIPAELGKVRREADQDREELHRRERWRPTPDGDFYWRSDTSADEIVGHFLAFYTYWRHIAQYNAEESALIERQVRAMADHIIENDYVLIDWHGERTFWGVWRPEILDGEPWWHLEIGLNSLQLLSFMKTAYAITGDQKYQEQYEHLICEHKYLNNLQLAKRVFPDEVNHSDDQLAYGSWYPLLQLEWDPDIRRVLRKSIRRHYKIIEPERASLFYFVSATIDPGYVLLDKAVEHLREIPRDRRLYATKNSHRADVRIAHRPCRFGRDVLDHVLPYDELFWEKWNKDPYRPDRTPPTRVSPSGISPGASDALPPRVVDVPDGAYEDDGGAWLLAYWLGRYHGFIAPPE